MASRTISSIGKDPDGITLETIRWTCRRKQVVQLLKWAQQHELHWLEVSIALAYNFMLRVQSELFNLFWDDVEFIDLGDPTKVPSLKLTFNSRKNRQYRHALTRECTCRRRHKDGTPGALMCPVHAALKFRALSPAGQVARLGNSTRSLKFMSGIPAGPLNSNLKRAARETGDPHWDLAESHGMRRGAACDLAMDGKSLAEILQAGDWKSAAFRAYLKAIQGELAGQAMAQLLGEASDEEE